MLSRNGGTLAAAAVAALVLGMVVAAWPVVAKVMEIGNQLSNVVR